MSYYLYKLALILFLYQNFSNASINNNDNKKNHTNNIKIEIKGTNIPSHNTQQPKNSGIMRSYHFKIKVVDILGFTLLGIAIIGFILLVRIMKNKRKQ